jgi:chorismate mutase
MTDQEQRLANERKEISDRVANFKAMQAKFQREREEYCTRTLRNACEGKTVSYWR